MRVWEKIDPFQEERGSWNGWLTALTRHAALNHARRISRHGGAEALSEDPPLPEADAGGSAFASGAADRPASGAGGSYPPVSGFCFTENTAICPHRPDRLGAGAYGAGGGGTAIPAETAAAEISGR